MRGLAQVFSPSPDPVSIALDAAEGIITIIGAFQAKKNARQAQENTVVQVQNQLAAALDPLSKAKDSPNVTVDDLEQIGDKIAEMGLKFYNYTLGFNIAGPGARQTIFGDEVAPGQFQTTDAHPGWLTRLLDDVKRKIISLSGGTVEPQLGFNWEELIGIGANIAGQVGSLITGAPQPVFGQTGSVPPGTGLQYQQQMPQWLLPALVIGGIILLTRK